MSNDPNPKSTDDLGLEDIVSVCPDSDNLNHKPCTYTPDDCCYCNSYPSTITADPCKIWNEKDLQVDLTCDGRILTININLKHVCPNKKIAIAVLLFKGTEVKGFKAKEIVTPSLPKCPPDKNCTNVTCKFCFIIPESICHPLTLKPKVIAHYIGIDNPKS